MTMNLLLNKKMPSKPGPEVVKLLKELQQVNPGSSWSIRTERMGCDKSGVHKDAIFWFHVEVFKFGGREIFEIDRRAEHPDGVVRDLRV